MLNTVSVIVCRGIKEGKPMQHKEAMRITWVLDSVHRPEF
jgi:hypothetical protein